MEKLTNKEEAVMELFWKNGKAFVREIREQLPAPQPAFSTVSTVVRKLEKKGYLAYEDFGATYRYYPLISREEYTRQFLGPKIARFFDRSYKNVVAFFAQEEKITADELREIIKMIEEEE